MTSPYNQKRIADQRAMCASDSEDRYRIDPTKLPKQININLSPAVEEQLLKLPAATGRSLDELILEILDQGLKDRPS